MKPGLAPGAEIREVAVPTIGPRDVLLKIKAVAICGSDIHIYHSSPTMMSLARPPLIFGHEACGEVVEVGEQVTGLALGDLVAVETHIPCGTCYQCQTGGQHVCERLTIFGVQTDGAFAEYARVPEIVCWKLPGDTSPDLGAILEPLGVAVHGVLSGEIGGRSVAVFGCGPVGILALQAASALGATRVFAVEIVPARLKLAHQCAPGAVLINPEKVNPVEAILEASQMPHRLVVGVPNAGHILLRRADAAVSVMHVKDGIDIRTQGGKSYPGHQGPDGAVIGFKLMV